MNIENQLIFYIQFILNNVNSQLTKERDFKNKLIFIHITILIFNFINNLNF